MADDGSVSFGDFAGLRNTVSPEALGPKELARARNIDLDDAGKAHRRRGYHAIAAGRFHSLFTTREDVTFVVKDSILCQVVDGPRFIRILAGIGDAPLCYAQVGPTVYFSSEHNSGQVDLASMTPSPWGLVRDHSYQPGLAPGPADWWWSPVPKPGADLGPVGGKLLGAPPLATCMAPYNGRIYMGAGRVLWATELFLYNYVDKNRGYRYFEADITCVGSVDDGVWVGTRDGLYYLTGQWGTETRSAKAQCEVLPGSMVEVPAEMIAPQARARPDIPTLAGLALVCSTSEGMIACLPGGQAYNLTRAQFIFPDAHRAASMYRHQDGIHQVVTALDSGGTPADNARFGDYLDATLIRASTATKLRDIVEGATATVVKKPEGDEVTFVGIDGTVLFQGVVEQ